MTIWQIPGCSLIRKEFIQIMRDPRTLALVLVIPVMQLFLLGYAATNDVRNVPLAVLDQDRSAEARALLDAYRAADYTPRGHFLRFCRRLEIGGWRNRSPLCGLFPASRRLQADGENRSLCPRAVYFRIAYEAGSEEELGALLDRGQARAGLIIPPGYGERLNGGETAAVAFVLDGSDPTVASTARRAHQRCGPGDAAGLLAVDHSRAG